MLFEPERHSNLNASPWSAEAAKRAIEEIIEESLASLAAILGTPKNLYQGSAGVLWALNTLGASQRLPRPKEAIAADIYRAYLTEPDDGRHTFSYLAGESGILALLYRMDPTSSIKERLLSLIEGNLENYAIEVLWGSPGTTLLALHLWNITQDEQFLSLYQRGASSLLAACTYIERYNCWYWPSREGFYIGACHGLFGCFEAILRGASLLSAQQREQATERAIQTALSLAQTQKDQSNWLGTLIGPGSDLLLVQWCHGAPGIICSLTDVPLRYHAGFDQLLLQAGELVYSAGPVQKGANLCHGTSGNGYALLALYARTKDPRWLERARAFAMHAITQRSHEPSLWTGDLGLACFLQSCIAAKPGMPLLSFL